MMESQETNNPQAETSATDPTSEQNPSAQGANPNGENSEANSDTAPDAQAQKELEAAGTDTESSATSEQLEGNKLSPSNSEGEGNAGKEPIESANKKKERFSDWREIGFLGKLGMSQINNSIYNNIGKVLNWLDDISRGGKIYVRDLDEAWNYTKDAIDLIARLLKDIEELRKELKKQDEARKSLEDKKRHLDQANRQLQQKYDSLNRQLENSTAELSLTRQSFETKYRQQVQELQTQCARKTEDLAIIQQEKATLQIKLDELEASRNKLLAETASLKRNTGTHYDGTSDRPQHHVLTGEHKNLREQHLYPLADKLWAFMLALNPQLRQQRREKLNDIRAAISATVLLGGQAIMQGESTASVELPSGILDDLLGVLCQRLQLNNQDISPETTELLNKAANLAQGKVQYPAPGQWKEQDFLDASAELSARLYQALSLERTSLSQELQEATPKAIQNALRFLERAALADPPASLSLYNEGTPFRSDYHEAAKGWDDEGTVIKTIYPVYLVNGEAKVKAVVLTKPSGEMSPDALPPNPITNAPETTPTDITGDATEKIRLEAKRESLINGMKSKWFENQYYLQKDLERDMTDKLSKIEQIDIIEALEKELHKVYSPHEFLKKVNDLLPDSYSQ